ncbi:MAG TPA: FtsW/RodA/SpoVE family cell cycle protein [Candidatus Dormibacteraeota bacterium]|nr:FtsW/RodA/SpoVE family cell cycle protein [Candidatus Dormibacteraeota bacterium]
MAGPAAIDGAPNLWAIRLRHALRDVRPRPRWRELGLLVLVGAALAIGSLSLGSTESWLSARAGDGRAHAMLADQAQLVVFLGALLGVHLAQVLTGRRTDEVLLPAVGALGGVGLLLMERLPQDLAGGFGGLSQTQLVWWLVAFAVLGALAIVVRSDAWLRLYKYTWAAAGIALLLLTFVLGQEVNGARLSVTIGPITGQPSELLKVVLVVFLAGYLSENRPLLVEASTRLGPIRLPPLPYLVPMVAMWAIALGIVVVQRDLGTALLFFAVFLLLVYIATARWGYVLLGAVLFVLGAAAAYEVFGHVRERVDIWLDPWSDPLGTGYQVVQALIAFARGGLLGTGLGAGLPTVNGRMPIPAVHTDFPFAALGEELGLVGILAILGLYLVIVERGLRIAAAAADEFRSLLAAGLALVVGVQAFIIAAGDLKLIPLTGVTLPFISYGGSSLLANALVVGLLLAISDKGVEPPKPPRRRVLFRRQSARAARAASR